VDIGGWTAVIDVAGEGAVDEDLVGELVDALADYGAVARAGRGSFGVIINVGQADDAVTAAIDGEHAFRQAVALVGLPDWPVVRPHRRRPALRRARRHRDARLRRRQPSRLMQRRPVPDDVAAELAATRANLEKAQRKVQELAERRDDLIRTAHAAGASWREIADTAGVSHTWAKKVVTGSEQPAP